MAALTPGVLSKLLEHASTDVKVAGEHRSSLLQVIGIVPRGEDPLQSRGFFLKVSDSLHSAYVSVSDDDADLIFSDKIQLGQFVYVSRLDSASPVPVLRGIKPVPKRRPCIGNPKDLFSCDLSVVKAGADSKTAKKAASSKENGGGDSRLKKVGLKSKTVTRLEDEGLKSRRVSLGNCRVENKESRRLSLDSLRIGWDRSLGTKHGARSPALELKLKETLSSSDSASVLSDKKASSKCNSLLKSKNLGNTPLKHNSSNISLRNTSKPSKKDLISPPELIIPSCFVKLHFSPKNWDHEIPWDALPSNLYELGKNSVRHRNDAFLAAVDALQEASAAESVIRSLCMFAELCEFAKQDSSQLLVDHFLNLHENMQRAATVTDAILKIRSLETKTSACTASLLPSEDLHKIFIDKNAAAKSWVQAAMQDDLTSFSLFSNQDKNQGSHSKQHHYVVLDTSDPAEQKLRSPSPLFTPSPPKVQRSSDLTSKRPSRSRGDRRPATKKCDDETIEWSKELSLKEIATLADRLFSVSRCWFLKYLDGALDDQIGRRGEGEGAIAGFLGQLKRVNQWLEDATGKKYEVDESVERLRKKLYKFLLEHVDSSSQESRI